MKKHSIIFILTLILSFLPCNLILASSISNGGAPSTNSATITCKGYKKNQVRITAKVPSYVKSKDNYYYLFRVNSYDDKLLKAVKKVKKTNTRYATFTFQLNTSGHPEYVMSKYALAVKTGSGKTASSFSRISKSAFVSSPEKTADYTTAYKNGKTKKGLQTISYDQAVKTDSKNLFMNIYASTFLTRNGESVPYVYNGKTFYFNLASGYQNLVSQCNAKGIQVTAQLLLDYTPLTKDLTAAGSQQQDAAFYAWNTKNANARQKMEALFCFLSEIFGKDNCYISNWILGNEINTYRVWNNPGNMTKSQYITSYSEAFRCYYNAIRSVRASSKVFICLDHYWNLAVQGYASKEVLDSFASTLKKLQPNVNWNLAYHAYPFPLTDPRFWNANTYYTSNSSTASVISLNNLNALTDYIKKTYGSKTRIILSEQGFTSTKGEDAQAASIALGYYIAACNPMIDAFIIRSYTDEPAEVNQGLAFGIYGKKAYKMFQYMDTARSTNYTQTYLKKQVGSNWTSRVPGYNKKYFYKNYSYK